MNKLPIYNIAFDEENCGIEIMSLVNDPAVDVDFIALAKFEDYVNRIDDLHIVFGCALRADYPIYRGGYYINFPKETVKALYELFMVNGKMNNVNLEHKELTEGVYLIQTFLKDVENGINPKGFEDISDGSWFCGYKILNEDLWNKIKSGEYNGFSIEGNLLAYLDQQMSKIETDIIDELIDELK